MWVRGKSGIVVLVVSMAAAVAHGSPGRGVERAPADAIPPRVTPPDDIWVAATDDGGAKGSDSHRLAVFLAGGKASNIDDVFAAMTPPFGPQPPIVRLPPIANGTPVDNGTLFSLGVHTITFRFQDQAGNIGTADAHLTVFDLRDDDLFVGVPAYVGSFGESYGTVKRIRAGDVTDWCTALYPDHLPDYFETPNDIVVDSRGRVVVIARVHRPEGWGLFRCNGPGQPIEKLVFLPRTNASSLDRPDYPSLPDSLREREDDVFALHLAREKAVVIDDEVNHGLPRVATEDAYVFKTRQGGTSCGEGCGPERSLRYRTQSDSWELGPEPINQGGYGDMTNHNGETFSVSQWGIRHEANPLQIEIAANFPGFGGTLQLNAFGGRFEIFDAPQQRLILDDTRKADTGGGCDPVPPFSLAQPDMAAHPNAYTVFGGALEVAFDEGGFGLTVGRFAGGEDGAYLTNVSQVLLDADPFNDTMGFYVHDFGCTLNKKVEFTSITDHNTTSLPRSVRRLTATVSGLVGTAHTGPSADVIRIRDGHDETLASFAAGPLIGIGGWPPMAGESNAIVLLVRVDSPIDALLTDSFGRRLGVDNGVAVNDFGTNGFDSGPGEPRVIGIKGVSAGDFTLRSTGTGAGPYAVHVYAVKLDEPAGEHILMRGDASPGSAGSHDFTLGADGRVFFIPPPPVNHAPICSAVARREVAVTSTHAYEVIPIGGVPDPDGDDVTIAIAAVQMDEPDSFGGMFPFPAEILGSGVATTTSGGFADLVRVRSERNGTRQSPGNGRVYHILFSADDGRGGVCTGDVAVGVRFAASQPPQDDYPAVKKNALLANPQ